MANYYRNQAITDYFTVLDVNSNPILGATIVVELAEDPNGNSFTANVVEQGVGVYSVTFTPTLVGNYYYRLKVTSTTPNQYFESEYDIDPGPVGNLTYDSIGSADGTTLYELIRMTAVRLGDFKQIIATQGSSTNTSFVDNLRLSAIPSSSLKGANFWIASPINSNNFWYESRVKESSEDTQVLTLAVALPEFPAKDDIAWLTNLNSKGHWRQDYIDALNNTIQTAHPKHLEPLTYAFNGVWSMETRRVAIPLNVTHIYSVEYDNVQSGWQSLPMAPQNNLNFSGWSVDLATKELLLNGGIAAMASGNAIRLRGYGRSGVLSDPSDMTSLNPGWLHLSAAALLLQGKGDQKLLAQASMLQNQAAEYEPAMITMLQPDTIRIR